jgi:hypothetical protein
MSQELLDAIRNYRPPKKLHPIAGKAYDLYDRAGFELTDEAIAELRADLEGLRGDLKALTDAMCGLSAFVIYANEKLNDPVAAEQIAQLMREQRAQYEPLSQKVTEILQDFSKKVRGLFDRFTDRDLSADTRAPTYDEPAPPETVPLKQLKPAARPPPLRKKDKER